MPMRLFAPAKVNWTLEALGRREDGYHEVRTVMQTIDLCDTLEFAPGDGVRLEVEGPHEVSEDDLVLRAAALLDGGGRGARIRLRKRIPVAAGLGGGSSLDCAKAANIIACNGGQIGDYDLTSPKRARIEKALPWISIPTTAGTGSEVGPVTVVTDSRRHVKFSISSPRLIAEVCIADPVLTASMPPSLTAWTGADALTHAIEAYYSRIAFPVGSALALESVRLLGRHLPDAVRDGRNLAAREQVLLGSLTAGIAFAQNGLGLTHAIAHQLTSDLGLHHGLANGIVLPAVLDFNARGAPHQVAAIGEALGVHLGSLSRAEAAQKVVEAIVALLGSIGIPRKVGGAKLPAADVQRLVAQAMGDSVFGLNPVVATAEEVAELYAQVLP